MIFTKDLLEVLSKKDSHIRFLLNTHEQYMKEERIDFHDSLTGKNYTFCFDYNYSKLTFFIINYAGFSISEKVRICQIEKTFLPILISVVKEHPNFRIKLTLKEYSIDDQLLNRKIYYYSLQDLLDEELYDIENYYFLFSFSFIMFCLSLFMLYLAFTRLSSIALYIVFVILFVMITFFSILLAYFFKAFYVVIKQYLQLKKIKKL
jgi:hypothetical protein